MSKKSIPHRRIFIKQAGTALLGTFVAPQLVTASWKRKTIRVNGHLWVYASKYPPNWDCTPNLESVFSDFAYAGMDGVEIMEPNLRHDNSVSILKMLINKYRVPVSGSSYGVGFNMWDREQHKKIMEDLKIVVPRLKQVGGKTLGTSVGSADRPKTEQELDAQATILKKVMALCGDHGIELNLHNHTYEVENGLHDLKGTLVRIPNIKLGPDLNWLIRAGVDPVEFINTYGEQIVYAHIRDQYANGTWTEYVGQGDTDFPAIAAALKSQNFRGQVAIELAFPNDFTPANPLKEDWKHSREYVQRVFGW
ncbi:sugar phosphate isomerase/epimerase [Flavobacteriaceae bacterium F89]|uniref:Sugar phosphate isomerase/epimerase n=1 Tax=Cerina litoralis TaxID=2874477 RepID=A0AAE3ES45_9FLAO|nr:sugar phosphate isomerase/epimerase [Cerina litoralis]MCG2459154.1 sugar phosphate isomerase/epimerase [Cerina litoralis]